MALTITNPTLTTTFDSTEVDANFADVVNKFDSGIVDADINASASIGIDKISASYQEVWLVLKATAVATGIEAVAALPGSTGDTEWKVTDISWAIDDDGTAGTTSFDVEYGTYSAGTWTQITSLATGSIVSSTANQGQQGRALEGGSISVPHTATVPSIAINITAAGTAMVDLTVTVALRRQITS
jgi:hypothetical protein